jgi:PhnB protein
MAKYTVYLNFDGETEAAFNFYKSVFGGEFEALNRFSEIPGGQVPPDEANRVMHVALPLNASFTLQGADIMPSMGHVLTVGNNTYVSIEPDSKAEADRLFSGLSAGGKIEMAMADTFWWAYFGAFMDKFGIQWMINFNYPPA